jgi:hypothetical protein
MTLSLRAVADANAVKLRSASHTQIREEENIVPVTGAVFLLLPGAVYTSSGQNVTSQGTNHLSIDNALRKKLEELEESLWIAETRFDRDYLETILHPAYVEFGCSGRRYTRDETLDVGELQDEIPVTLPLPDLTIAELSDGVMQVIYISEEHWSGGERRCNRSSIWIRTSSGWQLRFHQATRIS